MITVTPVIGQLTGKRVEFSGDDALDRASAFVAGLPENFGYIMVDPDRSLEGLDPVIEQRRSAPQDEET